MYFGHKDTSSVMIAPFSPVRPTRGDRRESTEGAQLPQILSESTRTPPLRSLDTQLKFTRWSEQLCNGAPQAWPADRSLI